MNIVVCRLKPIFLFYGELQSTVSLENGKFNFVKQRIPKNKESRFVLTQSITVSSGLTLVTLQDFASKI